MLEVGGPAKEILHAAREAGRQLVRDGKMSPENLRIISRELLPQEKYMQLVNQHFKEQLDKMEK